MPQITIRCESPKLGHQSKSHP